METAKLPSQPRNTRQPRVQPPTASAPRTGSVQIWTATSVKSYMAGNKQRVDRISRWSPRPAGELESAPCQCLSNAGEIHPGSIPFHPSNVVGCVGFGDARDPGQQVPCSGFQLICSQRIRLIASPAINHFPAGLQLGGNDRFRQLERMRLIGDGAIQCRPQMHVPSGGWSDDEADRTPLPKRHDSNPTPYTSFQGLSGDLAGPEQDYSINGFKRHPLVAIRRRQQPGTTAMPYLGPVIANIERVQVPDRNTSRVRYLDTVFGALVNSGKQCERSWHCSHRASLGADGNVPSRSWVRMAAITVLTCWRKPGSKTTFVRRLGPPYQT